MRVMPSFGHTRRASMDFTVTCDADVAWNRSAQPLAAEPGQEIVQVIGARIGDNKLPRAFLSRLDLDRGPNLLGQLLLEPGDVAVGVSLGLRGGVKDGVHEVFRLAYRQAALRNSL